MARIEWQPIAIPDIGESSLRAQQMASTSLRGAFQDITGVLNQYENDRREDNLAELYTRQNAFAEGDDVTGYENSLANGDLIRGLGFLKPSDIAAARSFTNELRAARNADTTFEREGIRWDRETDAYERGEANRIRSDEIAQTFAPLLAEARRTGDDSALEAAMRTWAPEANAQQLSSMLQDIEGAVRSYRGSIEFERGGERFGWERENRQWTVEDREVERQAEALALQFQEYGPNATIYDLINSPGYQDASTRVRIRTLQMANLPQLGSDSAYGAYSGGGSGTGASWAEEVGLVNSESGGNWGALNSEGYGGRLQFGDDRLAEAAAAGLVPRGTTGAQFSRMSPQQQIAVENWHFEDIDRQAERLGLTRYYGQTIAGVPINRDSIRGMAHLGGIGGARDFILSNGSYNPDDSNGTRISTYGRRFGTARISGRTAQVRSTDAQVGATVLASTDRYGRFARTIVPALTDDTPDVDVINGLMATDRFRGEGQRRVGRLIREVQDRYRNATGGTLSAAAAAEILTASMTPIDVGKDILNRATGRASYVGTTGTLLTRSTNTLNWTTVDGFIDQLRPNANGEIPLATSFINQEDRATVMQQAPAMRAQLAAAQQRLAIQRQRYGDNNPITRRLAEEVAALEEQFVNFINQSEGVVQNGIGGGPRQANRTPAPASRTTRRAAPEIKGTKTFLR